MSTAGEIWDVYQAEIADKSRLVYRKGGALPFFNGDNLRVQPLFQVPDDGRYIKLRCGRVDRDWESVSEEDD